MVLMVRHGVQEIIYPGLHVILSGSNTFDVVIIIAKLYTFIIGKKNIHGNNYSYVLTVNMIVILGFHMEAFFVRARS